jgi:hypothetical protein
MKNITLSFIFNKYFNIVNELYVASLLIQSSFAEKFEN